LPEALATIACEVHAIHPAGDREIVVGFANHLEHRDPDARPLLFHPRSSRSAELTGCSPASG
jgi:flavin reductase (DIM6/NTAB) family NADH-FMN oxidoreductase RutF